ncbi:hypothetical protein THIAE_03905 [Thiomicrospira aerophila AL3]|uniref:Uncharacterized protein n=1 Tax=Thiomicrospira aerophila AL3 TaxID=717772 RepID=W0DZF0_9GAMM|nr:hypothetical protein THIAE_03905 [Thiomicrospira aerophila AL3]
MASPATKLTNKNGAILTDLEKKHQPIKKPEINSGFNKQHNKADIRGLR